MAAAVALAATPAGPARSDPGAGTARPYAIVAVGTSLTDRGRWPAELQRRLAACRGRPVSVTTVARGGGTTDWALTQVGTVTLLKPDAVLMELYVNDAALHRFVSVEASRNNIAAILGQLRHNLPGARLAVMAMSPQTGLKRYLRPFVDDYISAHFAEAGKRGARTIDFRPDWAGVAPAVLAQVMADGSHPDPAFEAELMLPRLMEFFGGCR